MSVLTDNYEAKRQDGDIIDFKIKNGENIYKGALAEVLPSTGYLYAGVDTAAYLFVGVAVEKSLSADLTTDGDGLRSVRVFRNGVFEFTTASAAITWVGSKVYVVDSGTVALVATTSHDVYCGVVVDYISATKVRVDIGPAINEITVGT